jgi:hypothetical protein
MLERCHRITRFIRPGRETFLASEELQDAVIRDVEVIGEAAKRVSADARGRLAPLDWKAICGMRDVLIHRAQENTETSRPSRFPPLPHLFMTGGRAWRARAEQRAPYLTAPGLPRELALSRAPVEAAGGIGPDGALECRAMNGNVSSVPASAKSV